jgi:hypothetical protein
MHFVPLQFEDLNKLFLLWSPFLEDISKRSKEPLEQLFAAIKRREVQIALVWDGNKAYALVGMRFVRRGGDVIGEIVWLTGKGMKQWQHLLPEMEQYLRDRGCAEIRPICRPGWARLLKAKGYRITHYVMERTL